ncbi:MAG: hypothetical protein LBI59_05710, partial [Candidatus Accumulibacter sp.]|nr:hypothetical protein [Accumulibacter sp.]
MMNNSREVFDLRVHASRVPGKNWDFMGMTRKSCFGKDGSGIIARHADVQRRFRLIREMKAKEGAPRMNRRAERYSIRLAIRPSP